MSNIIHNWFEEDARRNEAPLTNWPKPLFHSLIKSHWAIFRETLYCPDSWTDSPLDALSTSWNDIERKVSEMFILCIPHAEEDFFEYTTSAPCWPEDNAHQYKIRKNSWRTFEEKQKQIEIYDEKSMLNFIEKYFNQNQKEKLRRYGSIDLRDMLTKIDVK